MDKTAFWYGFEKQSKKMLQKLFKAEPRKLDYSTFNKLQSKGPPSKVVYDQKGARSYSHEGRVSTRGPVQKPVYV